MNMNGSFEKNKKIRKTSITINLQQVQEVQQVLRFPSVHHLPRKRSNLLGISIRKT